MLTSKQPVGTGWPHTRSSNWDKRVATWTPPRGIPSKAIWLLPPFRSRISCAILDSVSWSAGVSRRIIEQGIAGLSKDSWPDNHQGKVHKNPLQVAGITFEGQRKRSGWVGMRLAAFTPLGTVLDDPVRQCLFETDVIARFLRLNPLVLQDFLALGLELTIERRILH